MVLLVDFLLRLVFGLALGMAMTSPRQVTSGYFRNHLYVTMGLSLLAALVSRTVTPDAFWYAVLATVCSYVGSVCWLYEKSNPGRVMLLLVALAAFTGGLIQLPPFSDIESDSGNLAMSSPLHTEPETMPPEESEDGDEELRRTEYLAEILRLFSFVSSGLLLGTTMAAMLLGHWYLNSPTMELGPLRRLLVVMAFAVGMQIVVSGLGLWGEFACRSVFNTQWVMFVVLRWLFGLVGVAALVWMAWQTLKIPNTQSATGILYVAVIGTFVGETMSLLLSGESMFPL